MKRAFKSLIHLLYLNISVALISSTTLSAQEVEPENLTNGVSEEHAEQKPKPNVHDLNSADLNAWLDGYIPYALREMDVVGAVVTIVKDNTIIANRGYGFADMETAQLVDADKTLFRPGSISKLFTWTAVMQQVEAGKLDLDADINDYLDFEIATPQGQVTMRHLMTHTPGFQTVIKDLFSKGRTSTDGDLRNYLVTHIPPQLFEPGKIPAYSNYGTALAGYIVERISGEPFASYIEKHIFEPLGMTNSSFRQPLPDALNPNMSKGYQNKTKGKDEPFEVVLATPAGALSSTGSDMARFMIAHLNGGAGLISTETAAAMHNTLHNQFPSLNGMALGFYRVDRSGLNIISHAGDTAWFHSNLFLYLDKGVGVYMSVNSAGKRSARFRSGFLVDFTERYFPATETVPVTQNTAVEHGNLVAGIYEISRAADKNALAVGRFLGQTKISVNGEGELVVPFIRGPSGVNEPLKEIAPWVWQSKSGKRISARVINGKVVALSGEPAVATLTPVPWRRSSTWLKPALYGAVAVMVLTFLAWPIKAFARRRLKATLSYRGLSKRAYRLAPVSAFLTLAYLGGWLAYANWLSSSIYNVAADASVGPLVILYWSGALPILATLIAGWVVKTRLGSADFSWFSKASAAALLIANLIIIWFASVVSFFSFSTNF